MKSKVMPPLILTLICAAVCALVVLAHEVTYVDNTGVLTKEMKEGCIEIFGQGDYEILTRTEKGEKKVIDFGFDHVNSIITDKKSSNCLIELTCDGYAKGGLHLMVGIDKEGKIRGLYFLSNGETPGLGANVANKDYTDKFTDKSRDFQIDDVDDLTAATYSSKGLKKACKEALEIYSKHKEEIFA